MSYARYKICIFGDGGVGKTTLVKRYITGKYSEDLKLTIGVEFYTKHIFIDDINVNLQIWDFAGEHQFKNLLPSYVIGADGGIFMYDISRFSSLMNLDGWLNILKRDPASKAQYFPILLVGGKADLDVEEKRSIEKEFANEYRKKRNLFEFIECSSKTNDNIENIFIILTRKILTVTGLL